MASLKSDCNLFSHLYITSKFCDSNLEDFFSHENHAWPLAISEHGSLCLPNKKSEILNCVGTLLWKFLSHFMQKYLMVLPLCTVSPLRLAHLISTLMKCFYHGQASSFETLNNFETLAAMGRPGQEAFPSPGHF